MADDIRVDVTRYRICGLPEDNLDASVWSLTVEARGHGKWAVMHLSYCYAKDGSTRDVEPSPSNRDEAFLRDYRFDSAEEAIQFAIRQYPKLVVNGLRVENGVLVRAR